MPEDLGVDDPPYEKDGVLHAVPLLWYYQDGALRPDS